MEKTNGKTKGKTKGKQRGKQMEKQMEKQRVGPLMSQAGRLGAQLDEAFGEQVYF